MSVVVTIDVSGFHSVDGTKRGELVADHQLNGPHQPRRETEAAASRVGQKQRHPPLALRDCGRDVRGVIGLGQIEVQTDREAGVHRERRGALRIDHVDHRRCARDLPVGVPRQDPIRRKLIAAEVIGVDNQQPAAHRAAGVAGQFRSSSRRSGRSVEATLSLRAGPAAPVVDPFGPPLARGESELT